MMSRSRKLNGFQSFSVASQRSSSYVRAGMQSKRL